MKIKKLFIGASSILIISTIIFLPGCKDSSNNTGNNKDFSNQISNPPQNVNSISDIDNKNDSEQINAIADELIKNTVKLTTLISEDPKVKEDASKLLDSANSILNSIYAKPEYENILNSLTEANNQIASFLEQNKLSS